jgi:chromate transporter
MAGQIGYQVAGPVGALVAVFATVAPSLLLMIAALGVVYRYRNSAQVKRMSQWVRPVIVVMMGMLVLSFFQESLSASGALHTLLLGVAAAIALILLRLHPAFVVSSSLVYGAIFLGY